MAAVTAPPVVAYATVREALEAVLGIEVPARAELTARPIIAVAARHHRDGWEGYAAEQLAGACGDVHLRAAGVTVPRVVVVATVVQATELAGDLARLSRSAVAVAAAWAA